MDLKIDILQPKAIIKKKDLNVITCIDWFEGGECAIYLLDENGKYSWQAIPRSRAKISWQQQGRYRLHVEKVPPIVFVKPLTDENTVQFMAITELMFSQCPEASELPVVNDDGNIVAVARLKHSIENEKMEWDKLRLDGVVLPDEEIFVSSLASPRLAEFYYTFEDTGKVALLTDDNVGDVLGPQKPSLLVYDQVILNHNMGGVNVRDLYTTLYSKRKIKDVAICGNGAYISIVADNIKKHFPDFRIAKLVDFGKESFNQETVIDLYKKGICGCIPACDTKVSYELLVKILASTHMPLINLYEGKNILACEDYANRKYLINNEKYPVYVLLDVYGIPTLTLNPDRTLTIYDAGGDIYDCSISYLRSEAPNILNCLEPLREKDDEIELDLACYVCEGISYNYWHFTFQIMNRFFAMEENGFSGKYIFCDLPYIRQIMELLRVPDERLVWLQNKENIRYKIHELHYVKFFENSRASTSTGISVMQRYALALLERNVIGVDISKYPKNIYVKRIGTRKLLGVDRIIEEFGFYTMIPEEHSLLQEILYFYAADVVLIPHGAGTANLLYMHEGATIIETFSRGFVNPSCSPYLLASGKRIKYRMIVSRGIDAIEGSSEDYNIPEELLRLILEEACSIPDGYQLYD